MWDTRASRNGRIEFNIVFNAQSLQEAQVLSTSHTLVKAVESIVQCSSSTKLSELDIISEYDTDAFFAWNGNPVPVAEDCVHDLVEKQVSGAFPCFLIPETAASSSRVHSATC